MNRTKLTTNSKISPNMYIKFDNKVQESLEVLGSLSKFVGEYLKA